MIEQVIFYWRRYGFLALIRKIYQRLFIATVDIKNNRTENIEPAQNDIDQFVLFVDPQNVSRLTLVTELEVKDQFNLDLALLLSVTLARTWARKLRILSPRITSKYRLNLLMHACDIRFTDNIDFRGIECANAGKSLEVSSNEIFVVTSGQLVMKLISSINSRQIIYLVHELPDSSSLTVNDKVNYQKVFYDRNIHFLFTSKALYDLSVAVNNDIQAHSGWLDTEQEFNPLLDMKLAAISWQKVFNGIASYLDKVKSNVSF